jgi:hypothetical protein
VGCSARKAVGTEGKLKKKPDPDGRKKIGATLREKGAKKRREKAQKKTRKLERRGAKETA